VAIDLNQADAQVTAAIKGLPDLERLSSKISAINPLLKKELDDVKRRWWHFNMWQPAMDGVCRHNNRVFKRHLPAQILLSVDVAFRLAAHMTSVGNRVDQLVENQQKLYDQIDALEVQRKKFDKTFQALSARKADLKAELAAVIRDETASLAIQSISLFFFPNPLSAIVAAKKAAEILSGSSRQPFHEAIGKINHAINNVSGKLDLVRKRKKEAVDHIDISGQTLRAVHEQLNPVLQTYGMVVGNKGHIYLKRGSWHCLPCKASFAATPGARDRKTHATPAEMFEIAVLEVGIKPSVCEVPYFKAMREVEKLKVAYRHRVTTQYLSVIGSDRTVVPEARKMEMETYARGSFGRVGHTSTGRFVTTKDGINRWQPMAGLSPAL
jgi:hypothetical protein